MADDVMKEEARSFCEQRANTYRLFASLFDKEITAETARQIAGIGASADVSAASAAERMAASGFQGMADDIAGFNGDKETELAVDYARVFLNAGRNEGQAAIPYESYYTSEEHLLMQDSRDAVRKLYREAGVMGRRVEGGGENPDDYLVFELSFMAVLNDRVAKALERDDLATARSLATEARDFRTDHLANWSDEFTKDMVETAKTGFYRYLAKAYRGFLLCEAEDTRSLVDVLAAFDGDPVSA
jgi:TorA maturation chaperone TorD